MSSQDKNIYTSNYHDIIKVVKDFFNGDNNSIKKELLRQINQCISDENFERAGKLRDIYNNIDIITQKQSAIIDDQSLDGIFFKIVHVWAKWIYVIIVLQKGKIIDILRLQEDDHIDIENIISAIELDFDDVVYDQDEAWSYFGHSKSIQPKASIYKIILSHIDDYITSFISSITGKDQYLINNILSDLQTKYSLAHYPYKIECLDISHINGSWASWWLSCMQWWLLYKKWYRQYKIKKAKWWDDYASLVECIVRRFKLEDGPQEDYILQSPDLFVIDGWIWQLWVLEAIISQYPHFQEVLQTTQFISLGKWSARKSSSKIYWEKEMIYRYEDDKNIVWLELSYDESDKILIKCRDEAHRFANRYRKKQMSKEIRK